MAADFHRISSHLTIVNLVVMVVLCLSGCAAVNEELSWKSQTHEEVVHGQQVGENKYTLTGNPFFNTGKGYMKIEGECRFKEIKQKVKNYTYEPEGLISLGAGLTSLPFTFSEAIFSALPLTPNIYKKDEELTAGIKEKYRDKEEIVSKEETGKIVTQNISLAGKEVVIVLPLLGYERITHLDSFGRFYVDPQLLYRYESAEKIIIRLSDLSEKEVWTRKISLLLKEADNFRPDEVCDIDLKDEISDYIAISVKPAFSSLCAGGHGEVEILVADKRFPSMAAEQEKLRLTGNIMLKNETQVYNLGNFDVGVLCPGDKVTMKCPVRIPALTSPGTYSFVIRYDQGNQHDVDDMDGQNSNLVSITPLSIEFVRECYAKGELLPEEIESLSKAGKLSKPEVVPVSISVDDRKKGCRGNGDGRLQRGETVLVTMTFSNQSAIPSGKTELLLLVNESGGRQKGIYFNPIRMSVGTFQAREAKEVDFLMTVDGETDIASVVIPFILRDSLFGELVNNFTSLSIEGL